jgi:diguanylate cyclase (GGDEF)-like protein
MNQDMLERILRCPNLPTLPTVAVRVIELTQNVNVSMDDLTATIQNDQGLAAKILKTVNSSFYGLRRPCASISQALVMLGLSSVKTLALSFSLLQSFEGADDEFDHVAYWRRGLYTATAAKLIAREAGLPQEEEAFLGGLLQDVGVMAMYMALGRSYLKVILQADSDHRKLARFELAALELQHPDVGAMLVQRWKLPAELVMPVKYHERPTAAPSAYAELVRCVGLGNLAHDVLTDGDSAASLVAFRERAQQWFEIDAPAADALILRLGEAVKELSALFRVKTGLIPEADAILARAKEQIDILASSNGREQAQGSSLGSLVNDGDEFDPLTGVYSREVWLRKIEAAFEESGVDGRSLTCVLLSIDRFDEAARTCGNECADTVLVEAAALIQATFDPLGGLVGRCENAAFGVLISSVDRTQAARLALEIGASIEAQARSWCTGGWRVTVSIGAATMEAGSRARFQRAATLVAAAHKAMTAAAGAGGNCVRTLSERIAA